MKQYLVFMVIFASLSVGMGFKRIIFNEFDDADSAPAVTSKSFTP